MAHREQARACALAAVGTGVAVRAPRPMAARFTGEVGINMGCCVAADVA